MPLGEKLDRRLRKAGLSLPADQSARLAAYFELLKKWNRKVSLTSLPVASDSEEAIDRLLVEPVLAARAIPKEAVALMDIGSGGGSPAIPIRIVTPQLGLRMVESKTRKAAFLREAVREMALTGASVEASRSEQLLIRPDLHESADVITVRAVRVEVKLLDGIQPFLRAGGIVLLFRGGTSEVDDDFSRNSLVWEATLPLLPHLQSRLVVLRNVPRGTTSWKS